MAHHTFSNLFLFVITILSVVFEGETGNRPDTLGIVDAISEVSIQENKKHICSGAFLPEQYVLTAASCLCFVDSRISTRYLTVVMGTDNLSKNQKVVKVSRYSCLREGPQALALNFEDDIAIIKLEKQIYNCAQVAGKTIAYQINEVIGECKMSGWRDGKLIHSRPVTIDDRAVCSERISRPLTDKSLCSFSSKPLPELNDKGSSLICNNFLHGLLVWSFRSRNGAEQSFVYTNVGKYAKFIADFIRGDYENRHKCFLQPYNIKSVMFASPQ